MAGHVRRRLLALSGAASLVVTGCLIPEAPEYDAPKRSPVFINDNSIDPDPRSLLRLKNTTETGAVPFTVKVRSEDAGERLVVALLSDYKHQGGFTLGWIPYEPSTLDEERTVSVRLQLPDANLTNGCHTLTLMVLHEPGFDYVSGKPIGAPSDLASVNWFAIFSDSGAPPSIIEDCPTAVDTSTEKSP